MGDKIARGLLIIGFIIMGFLALTGNTAAQSPWFFEPFSMFCMLLFIIPLVIVLVICVYIYRDANERGMNGVLWVVLLILGTFILSFASFIGIIIIYLVIRNDRPAYGYGPPPGYGYPPHGYGPPAPYYYGGYPPPPPPPPPYPQAGYPPQGHVPYGQPVQQHPPQQPANPPKQL